MFFKNVAFYSIIILFFGGNSYADYSKRIKITNNCDTEITIKWHHSNNPDKDCGYMEWWQVNADRTIRPNRSDEAPIRILSTGSCLMPPTTAPFNMHSSQGEGTFVIQSKSGWVTFIDKINIPNCVEFGARS
jgi:hypothetical protein